MAIGEYPESYVLSGGGFSVSRVKGNSRFPSSKIDLTPPGNSGYGAGAEINCVKIP